MGINPPQIRGLTSTGKSCRNTTTLKRSDLWWTYGDI